MAEPGWVPYVGEAVVYTPSPHGAPEDGVVKTVDVQRGTAMVQYEDGGSAKLTYLRDLSPARPSSVWG